MDWGSWREALQELIFPGMHLCIFCSGEVPGQQKKGVCDKCRDQILALSAAQTCSHCGYFTQDSVCPNCANWPFYLDSCTSVVPYRDHYRELVQTLKYGDKPELAHSLGYLMACRAAALFKDGQIHTVIAVPLHSQREKERGFNQSGLLAQVIARYLSLPLDSTSLIRKYASPRQSNLGRKERWLNMADVFSLSSEHNMEGQTVLLIDDIITTGSTLLACAQALKSAGAHAVYGLTWAAGFDARMHNI